jgi:hypothetical protein
MHRAQSLMDCKNAKRARLVLRRIAQQQHTLGGQSITMQGIG